MCRRITSCGRKRKKKEEEEEDISRQLCYSCFWLLSEPQPPAFALSFPPLACALPHLASVTSKQPHLTSSPSLSLPAVHITHTHVHVHTNSHRNTFSVAFQWGGKKAKECGGRNYSGVLLIARGDIMRPDAPLLHPALCNLSPLQPLHGCLAPRALPLFQAGFYFFSPNIFFIRRSEEVSSSFPAFQASSLWTWELKTTTHFRTFSL